VDFQDKFRNIVAKNNSLLCVGLDPQTDKLTKNQSLFEFNKSVINATADLVCAYKPNIAFYEAYGLDGLDQLKRTIDYLKKNYSNIPVVLDAKRADIGNTAKMYATSIFDFWGADATTVYPHLGFDSLEPFFAYRQKLTIVLIKTSNPDASTFQNLKVNGEPYYMRVAKEIKKWDIKNLGVFVGATYPQDLKNVRKLFPNKIILSAGFGAQKGKIKEAVKAGIDKTGGRIMFNASRSIIYSQDPKKEAQKLRDEINKYRAV